MTMMFIPMVQRSEDVQDKVSKLMTVLPYPRHWYESKSDREISGIYRNNVSKLVDYAIKLDAHVQERRLAERGNNAPIYCVYIVAVNSKTVRIMNVYGPKIVHGVITRYYLKEYSVHCTLERGGANFDMNVVEVLWETGKRRRYTKDQLKEVMQKNCSNDVSILCEVVDRLV